MTDDLLLLLYREWSEEFYAAGFMHPDRESVAEFRQWLGTRTLTPLEDYELEMLKEYHRQEAL